MSNSTDYWKLWWKQVVAWPFLAADAIAFLLWLVLFSWKPEGYEELIWGAAVVVLVVLIVFQFVFAPSRIYTRAARQWEEELGDGGVFMRLGGTAGGTEP